MDTYETWVVVGLVLFALIVIPDRIETLIKFRKVMKRLDDEALEQQENSSTVLIEKNVLLDLIQRAEGNN